MTDRDAHIASSLYDDYFNWKSWANPFTYSKMDDGYFSAELAGIPLDGKDVLEIGFGNGTFVAWARDQGARMTGTELNADSLLAAVEHDLPVLPIDFDKGEDVLADSFDLIVAFDVFEHLTEAQLRAKLRVADYILRPGGRIVLRYPNGQSPFGLSSQNGDATHILMLSRPKIEQYGASTGLKTVLYRGSSQPSDGSLKRRAINGIRMVVRVALFRLLNLAMASDVELAPNVLHILRKTALPNR